MRSSSRAGPGHKRDLRMVRPYIRDFKPVLIAVDGGADALLEAGYKPDVIVGDMDSVSDEALRAGAELVVHALPATAARPARRAPSGSASRTRSCAAPGISEDVALLLAYEKGAELIVAVGTHFNLIEFLERNRAGMSSTFITRLKVGEILVDAKGVSRLAQPPGRASGRSSLLALAGLARDRRRDRRLAGAAARRSSCSRCACATCSGSAEVVPHAAVAAERELLASRADVWAFLAEPQHLADWWPGHRGVEPDRRGLAEGARWEVVGDSQPALLRQARRRARRCSCSPSSRPSGFAFAPDRRSAVAEFDLEARARRPDRTRARARRRRARSSSGCSRTLAARGARPPATPCARLRGA